MLKEELQLLQEPGSYVGEVIKVINSVPLSANMLRLPRAPDARLLMRLQTPCVCMRTQAMGKTKVLVKVRSCFLSRLSPHAS